MWLIYTWSLSSTSGLSYFRCIHIHNNYFLFQKSCLPPAPADHNLQIQVVECPLQMLRRILDHELICHMLPLTVNGEKCTYTMIWQPQWVLLTKSFVILNGSGSRLWILTSCSILGPSFSAVELGTMYTEREKKKVKWRKGALHVKQSKGQHK